MNAQNNLENNEQEISLVKTETENNNEKILLVILGLIVLLILIFGISYLIKKSQKINFNDALLLLES